MEKKTIGSFIAALRKANGLTQKELAEKLNVSDKAVSRWERDECYPDLTTIPALAEIFGVSCDELLNGGRINSEERQPRQEQKTAKQIDFLINRVRASFAVHSAGIYALSALGLLAALVCNTVFSRAYLGFFLACVFYVGGLMWLTMKLIASFSALVYETESPLLDRVKEKIVRGAAGNLTGILIMFAAALPLIVVVNSPYYGLDISDWARYGLVFAGIAVLVFCDTPLVLILGALSLILTQGRHKEGGIIKKIMGGITSLYDITCWLSDVLSYARLMALMLAGSVIGMVFNTIAALPGNIIVFFVVFLIGHTFNIGVNLIGTYVHDARLQYLEFFGKFYKEGGIPFKPLKYNTKYVDIIEEEK